MKATVVDLRYHMRDVLKALNRNEPVEIFYHGKLKGIITPTQGQQMSRKSVRLHPLCGSLKADTEKSVEEIVDELRKGRFDDL